MGAENMLSQTQSEVRYYGKYRGFVVENKDPEKRGRLRVSVPSILGQATTYWALPCLPFGGLLDQGLFSVPKKSSQVWVEFEEGNCRHPIWTGTFWQTQKDVPSETADDDEEPTSTLLKTPSGHLLHFQDKSGEEQIRLSHNSGAELHMDEKGSVALTDSNGAILRLDAENNSLSFEDTNGNKLSLDSKGTIAEDSNGNKIEMAASGITVKGQQIVVEGQQVMLGGSGGEPILKGQSFLNLFMTHMHPTAMGPSGPPIPQGEMSSLSTKVKTS